MAPITKDDHIVLLFSCIKNSKGAGQIDWNGVATDTGLTTNAASKRYNKLADDYGVRGVLRSGSGRVPAARAKNRAGNEEGEQGDAQEDQTRAKGKGRQTRRQGGSSKKRKMKHDSEDEDEADGDAEQAVDYDALDAADDENHLVKNELEADDDDEEASVRNGADAAVMTDCKNRLLLERIPTHHPLT
ncbi:hypothetical protein M436DRAFT_65808 [Aureobasidium namibiae CBS 147.97]|uniref:Myb-like DNA-binding domain-containing protein n=1 Tax=Aureobasidium namibiae CBS 147.97 TaxID=1043004 RepID=A0A074X8N8_9PEZI